MAKKIWLMLSAIILTTVVAAGIYLTTAYQFSTSELAKTFKDYREGETSTAIQDTKPFSILLMGVDTGSGSRAEQWVGNSDSMLLVTVNPETNQTTMTSLERDILVDIRDEDGESTGTQAKLNAAYAMGGAGMAIATVEGMLDISIDYYMQINMQGLVDLVDAVGGITVTNEFDYPIKIYDWEPEYTSTIEPGTHHVNGDQALVYARMRYDDPEGDYGRQRRQRAVIQKIVKKLLALDSISSYRGILQAVSRNMQTDIEISASTLPSLVGYQAAISHLKSYQLYGADAEIDGASYQIVTAEHLLETQNRIKEQLGLETKTSLKTTAIIYETIYNIWTDIEIENGEGFQAPDLHHVPDVATEVDESSYLGVEETYQPEQAYIIEPVQTVDYYDTPIVPYTEQPLFEQTPQENQLVDVPVVQNQDPSATETATSN